MKLEWIWSEFGVNIYVIHSFWSGLIGITRHPWVIPMVTPKFVNIFTLFCLEGNLHAWWTVLREVVPRIGFYANWVTERPSPQIGYTTSTSTSPLVLVDLHSYHSHCWSYVNHSSLLVPPARRRRGPRAKRLFARAPLTSRFRRRCSDAFVIQSVIHAEASSPASHTSRSQWM